MPASTEHTSTEIGIFERRKIEAQIIKPIYEILIREFGKEKAQSIIAQAVANDAIASGQEFAAKEARPTSIESYAELQYLWKKDNALEIQVLRKNHEHYDYDVKRCRYAEMYHEMGLGEIGFLLSCNRDNKFIEGYAPQIRLTREHTVMQGDGYCDFRYQLTPKMPASSGAK